VAVGKTVTFYGGYGIPWGDRLFGTYRDPDAFAAACGYRDDREQRLAAMLVFRDVNTRT
jgi:sterol desaturase/sphingolipid hydroxylase (fatty acid hydroxylase superfamily)